MSRSKAIAALKSLSKQRFDRGRLTEVLKEINSGPDRSVAIVWAAVVEDQLRTLIVSQMGHLTPLEEAKLFAIQAPLSSFSGKIMMAYAMKLISADDRDDLDLIREIRNAFAHGFVNLSFNAKEVASVCSFFHIAKRWPRLKTEDPKMIFNGTCLRLWASFSMNDINILYDAVEGIREITSEGT